MFDESLGFVTSHEGVDCFASRPESFGCLQYGPYEWVEPGHYRVEFDLALAGAAHDPVGPRVLIDVTTSFGTVLLASESILSSELSERIRTVSLAFTLREYRRLEYRVHVPGNGAVIVGDTRLIKRGDLQKAPPVDVSLLSDDPFLLAHQVRSVLRLLRPQRALGIQKVRLGNVGDGGYICLDDFEGVDAALSFGINDDISWNRDAADRGLRIHQFDHTVDDPAPEDDRFVFAQKMIAPDRGPDRETITDLVRKLDKGDHRPNLFLKMDIENAEWGTILATDRAELSRFTQIVCELHYFQGLAEVSHRTAVYQALSRLSEDYGVIHVHANNYVAWTNLANVVVPCVLEVTFANRALYQLEDTDELFPTALDASCDPSQPDMYLGGFRF